ncbi:MAG: TIGR04282 family arsenosugar biosynthesis glycosyltransferase [Alphaproteobacteria bacterium]
MRTHVFLFAKEPRLGRVKSRLANDIGSLNALSFYRNNLSRVIRRLKGNPRFSLTVAVSPDRMAGCRPTWAHGVPLIAQGRGDLGQRMARAFRNAPPGPVIIIGSDIPYIRPSDLRRAATILGQSDAVFGPSGDGGYWLVGLKRLKPQPFGLFSNVRWSSPYALHDSVATLGGTTTVRWTDQLDDVDDGASYHCWKQGAINDRQ